MPPLPGNGPVPQRPPPMSMAPPPAREFNTREELLAFQKAWAEEQGFAVVIGRSRPNRLWIKCDRGGEYSDKHLHDPENRKRKRKATRLTGCPFNIKATMKKDKIWRCHTEVGEHNHPPSEDLSIHPSLRRMTLEQERKVNDMTEAGNTPVETLDELQRLWPGIKVLRRDIYNQRKKFKTEKEKVASPVANGGGSSLPAPPVWEDPNGKMPGPTKTGQWIWVEEGDEVKRKKRKKSSTGGPGQNPGQSQASTPVFSHHSGQQPPPHQSQQPSQQHGHHPQHGQPSQSNSLAPELRDPMTHSPQLPSPAPGAAPPRRAPMQPHRQYGPTQPSPVQSSIPPPNLHSTHDFPGPINPAAAAAPARFNSYMSHTHSPSGLGHAVSVPGQQQGHPHPNAGHQPPQRGSYGRQPSDPVMSTQPVMRASSHRSSMVQIQQPDNGANMPLAPMQSPAMSNGNAITSMAPQTSQNAFPTTGAAGGNAANNANNAVGGAAGERGKGNTTGQGQVLMSRIERMEKEQRDQKAMLTQILGAVQGMNGLRR